MLWNRSPWWPAATIWLAPGLEEVFTEDCRRAGLSLSATAPVVLNTLRWAWRRSLLNHGDQPGWQRALSAARKLQVKIGPPPDDFAHEAPLQTPPTDPRIKVVMRRVSVFEPARTKPVVDRATKSKQRRQKLAAPKTPPGFDWCAFFQRHWLDIFRPLWRAYRLDDQDVDGEVGRVLAIAYKDKLDEQSAGDGSVGPASRHWHQLLRQLRQGIRPGQTVDWHRQVPPIAPSPPSRLVAAPDNDEWLRELFDRIR
jgi:hypothetical protein